MWIIWALLSAIFAASRRPFEKNVINNMHHFTYGFLIQCISLPLLIILTIINHQLLNPLKLGFDFWVPVLVVSIGFYPLNSYLYKHAIKNGELSKVLPLQSLVPVFALFSAWATIKEVPGAIAVSGIIITVLGVYALGLKGKRLHHPLEPFRQDISSRAMLAGVLLVTVVSIFDKIAINASNPLFYSLVSTLGAIITLFIAMAISNQNIRNTQSVMPKLGIIGGLQGVTYATYLLAIGSGPIAYITAIRGSNILIGSIIGIIIFKEKLTKAKILSYLLIIFGSVLISLG